MRIFRTLLLLLINCQLSIVNSPSVFCQLPSNFKVIGHKGSCYNYPDNTLYSLEQAFVEGVWAAECDVRPTLDGTLVLCHEGTIDKATNNLGYIDELKYSYLKTFDAGSWKDKRFAGLNIPTLIEALKLADKYHKKMYLDMVGWQADALASAIKAAGVPQDICFTDPSTFDEITAYRAVLPDMPLVYFGDQPADINDESFYSFLKNNNVIAVEVYVADIIDTIVNPWTIQYRDNLHKYGIDLWAYTVNDTAIMRFCQKFGIDGIESDRPAALKNMFINKGDGGHFPEKRITGQWDFNNKDLSPTIGSKMIERGEQDDSQKIIFNTALGFGIPLINGVNANVMLVQPYDSLHFLEFYSNITPEGLPSPIRDWNYTLIMDLLKPAKSHKPYIALYQTDAKNLDDATVFIKTATGGIGIYGKYDGKIESDTWYRIALVFDAANNRFDKYIDGQYVGTTVIPNGGKFAIYNNWGGLGTLLFADNSGETDSLYVNSIQLRSYIMDAAEVAMLGKASALKIPQLLTIDPLQCPVISLQPVNASVSEGGSVSFSVKASPNLNYLWQMKTLDKWEDIKGSCFDSKASPVLNISNAPVALNKAQFRCIVSNDCYVTSAVATLTVRPFNATFGSVSGRLIYDNLAQTPIANTRIYLYDTNFSDPASAPAPSPIRAVYSDANGNYSFSGLPASTYKLLPLVTNAWNGSNPTDALIIGKYFVKLLQLKDDLTKKAADVNLDDLINTTDALLINKRFVKLSKAFPSPDWLSQSDAITVNANNVSYNILVICAGDVNGSYKP